MAIGVDVFDSSDLGGSLNTFELQKIFYGPLKSKSSVKNEQNLKIHLEISKFDLRFCSFFTELFDFRGPKKFSGAQKYMFKVFRRSS